jgi:hypothetical protein
VSLRNVDIQSGLRRVAEKRIEEATRDGIKSTIENLRDESKLDGLVRKVNDLIRSLNTLGTNAINLPVAPLLLDVERNRLRERLAQEGSP